MIFQGIRISIAKKPSISMIFQGGSGPLSPPLGPSMHSHVLPRQWVNLTMFLGMITSFIASGDFSCANPERGQGVRITLKNHKNIGFLSNAGTVPLNNQASIQCRAIIGPPAKHFNGVSLAGRCVICNSITFHSLIFKLCMMIVHALNVCTSYFVHF